MIKYAKPITEIIEDGKSNLEIVEKLKQNANSFKKDYFWFIDRRIIPFYIVTCLISIMLIVGSLCGNVRHELGNVLVSLSCSFISGIIVAFFIERNTNKKWYHSKIKRYNYDFSELYASLQQLTGFSLLSEAVIGNYALNDYAKSKGIVPCDGASILLLEHEVKEQFKDRINEIPGAKVFASTFIVVYIRLLESIISKVSEFIINYHDYLSIEQTKKISEITHDAIKHKLIMSYYEQRIFVVNVESFDKVILWAQNVATREFVFEFYAQE